MALEGEVEFLVVADAVYDEGGRELGGAQIRRLMVRLDHARLETLWRELHRSLLLGSWVVSPTGAFEGRARVVGFRRAGPGEEGHQVLLSTASAQTFYARLGQIAVEEEPGEPA